MYKARVTILLWGAVGLSACGVATVEPFTQERFENSLKLTLERQGPFVEATIQTRQPVLANGQENLTLILVPTLLVDGEPAHVHALQNSRITAFTQRTTLVYEAADLLAGKSSVELRLRSQYFVKRPTLEAPYDGPLFSGQKTSEPLKIASDTPSGKPTLTKLEKDFQKMLTGATLVGHFTSGGKKDQAPREERYTITHLNKMSKNFWGFHVRMRYGGKDRTFAMPFQVVWAGDTPMITLTDLLIPGVGTYTARVFFYRGQYAGTWSGTGHGGHVFGRIVPAKAKGEKEHNSDKKRSPGAAAGQNMDLVYMGKVRDIRPSPLPQSRLNYVVTTTVEKVLSGPTPGKTFSFRIHSPARAGLQIGRVYRIQAAWIPQGYRVDETQWRRTR